MPAVAGGVNQQRSIMKISEKQVQEAYSVAKSVYENKLSKNEGADHLHNNHEINHNSAKDFINNFECLVTGSVFKRNLKTSSIEYFSKCMYSDYGIKALVMCIRSLELHIQYWETLQKGTAYSKRDLLDKLIEVTNKPKSKEEYFTGFDEGKAIFPNGALMKE